MWFNQSRSLPRPTAPTNTPAPLVSKQQQFHWQEHDFNIQFTNQWHSWCLQNDFLSIQMTVFPGSLGVKVLGFHCHGQGSIPGQGLRPQKLCSSQTTTHTQMILEKACCFIFPSMPSSPHSYIIIYVPGPQSETSAYFFKGGGGGGGLLFNHIL